ncbi:MAG: hypothetical protein QOD96_1486, partial [Pseudonocardiales bacterium]|nr:hypothetical protein [Pseudonocardiales bacterium]
YNDLGPNTPGQRAIVQILMRRATMHGFLVLDHLDRFGEATAHLAGLLATGRLHYKETILDGLDQAPEAMAQILNGAKVGKMVVRVAEPTPR